ncbi:MAG TPA: hypothetical protein VER32_15400 [Pyrinomonadaceae bacterium]|nr:hypothetical protein [Pyrinomonadaceae bacterium]
MVQSFAVGTVTALLMVAASAVGFFFMLLALNGFSERQASPLIAAYTALAILCALVAAVASGWGAKALARAANWSMWAAAPLAVVGACVAGLAVLFVGCFLILLVGSSLVR